MRQKNRLSFEELVSQNKNEILNDKKELERIDLILGKKMSDKVGKANESK